MQSLEAACEEGEVSFTCCQCNQSSGHTTQNHKSNMVCTHSRTFKKAKSTRTSLPLQPVKEEHELPTETSPKPFCIHAKLRELHELECSADPNSSSNGLKRNSHLLEKLVEKERLNTLILNLYPGNKGYSLSFPTAPNSDVCTDDTAEMIETKQWPYEKEELLRCINNEELPAFFLDVLEPHYSFLFYSGCIVAEVRDYRQAYPHFQCDIHHVLLKPTLQSILSDINVIMDERVDWGLEEKQQLESQMILANNPTLCLDPNNSLSALASSINHNRQLLNTHRLRRTARKFSQVTVNRKRKLDQFTYIPGLELYDYMTRARNKPRMSASSAKVPRKVVDEIKPVPVPSLEVPVLSPPTQPVEINEFKAYKKARETSDCLPQLIEEYVLETDMPSKESDRTRVYHIKLSILQRPSNSEYLGELYLDRDHKKGERNGVACRFSLGSRAHATRYVQQFTEIFTEGGRKTVRNYKERVASGQTMPMQTAQVNLVQQHIVQLSHLQNQQTSSTSLVNGTVGRSITLVQGQGLQNTSIPILQSQLQSNQSISQPKVVTSQEIEISAIATKLMNSSQQFQAANAKQQQQKLAASSNNAAILSLPNSSPGGGNLNSDANTAVVNAINNSSLLPQVQMINQKIVGRKITLSNVPSARVLNHSNVIAVNNNRLNLADLNSHLSQFSQSQQGQTITLTSVNSSNYAAIKQPLVSQKILNASAPDSILSAFLVDTPAADIPDIVAAKSNSLLLEKFAANSVAAQNAAQSPNQFMPNPKQFAVQSPKANPVISPPPQNSNALNVQGLNFAPLQNISGVQVQLPGFSQPISLSLNVSSTGAIQGHPSLIVSLPVTSTTATCTSVTQQTATAAVSAANTIGVGTQTVVLTNSAGSNLAQLVTSSVKGIAQQAIRAATPAGVTLTQGGQPFQLLAPLQRPRMQQTTVQQAINARNIQRTPITVKMAPTNSTGLPLSAGMSDAVQKQTHLHQYQRYYSANQVNNISSTIGGKGRRSNVSDPE